MTTKPEFTGHNGGPPIIDPSDVFQKIDDLFDEAKHWADGEPITSAEMAEAVTALYDQIHEAGKEADALRVKEKKPLDDQVQAIQDRYNKYVQPKKGLVAIAKDVLGVPLTAWRVRVQREAEERARIAREEAAALQAEATAALQASSGNLEARQAAENVAQFAKEATKFAARTEKAANTNTGLRTSWAAVMTDEEEALGWAYERAPGRFKELCQQIADEAARAGVRKAGGFSIEERKVAA